MANDRFADIAAGYKASEDRGLITPCPQVLENKVIKLENSDKNAFVPYKKMDTKAELCEELAKMRTIYEPFLKNFAPDVNSLTKVIDIKEFDYSLNGGEIEKITLPHYGGPVGKNEAVYSSEFELSDFSDKAVMICFKGVDYIAEVFVNDEFIGRHEGFFSPFEFEITNVAKPGKNTLKVKVYNDYVMMGNSNIGPKIVGDKIYAATGIGWDGPYDGWHHCPAGMGIYNDVTVEIREKEYISDIFVRNGEEVWIECYNTEIHDKDVYFEISVYGQNFYETVFENVKFYPETNICAGVGDTLTEAQLISQNKLGRGTPLKLGKGYNRFIFPINIENKKIWSQNEPNLYQIQIKMIVNEKVSACEKTQFGIRTFTQDNDASPKGAFYLNGKKIRLRGANTMGFEQLDVMRNDFDQLIDDILLAKICNMNFLRITQRPVQKEIYDYCDMLGLMVQTDLPLFGTIRINQYCEVLRQTEEMEKLIRSHPSCVIVSYINEPFPNASNIPHRCIKRNDMMNFFSAADTVIKLHNPDRVIKHVDGDYDPPSELMPDNHCYCMWYNGHGIDMGKLHKGYWLDVNPGWYYGCGEFGAEGLDFPEVMRECYPKEWLVEPFHPKNILNAQTGDFHGFFYETPDSMEKWVTESHRHQSFATKIMTGAMRRNPMINSFAIHLFIDAWPSGWMKTIMDFRRNPKPAYFTYKDYLSPVMCDLRTDRFTYSDDETVKIEAYIYNDYNRADFDVKYMVKDGDNVIASGSDKVSAKADDVTFAGFIEFDLPKVENRKTLKAYMQIEKDSEVIHYMEQELEVFPKIEVTMPESLTYEEYDKNRKEFDAKIENGEKVVFAPLKQGEYIICDKKIVVKDCGMQAFYFVSRDTGHEIVKGFYANDFKYMYDDTKDMIMPIIYSTIASDGLDYVLSSISKEESGEWIKAVACGVMNVGKGKVILNQIELSNKQKNPVIREYTNAISRF